MMFNIIMIIILISVFYPMLGAMFVDLYYDPYDGSMTQKQKFGVRMLWPLFALKAFVPWLMRLPLFFAQSLITGFRELSKH